MTRTHASIVAALVTAGGVLISGSAGAQVWASPTGMTGAGLGMETGQDGRAWGELGLYTSDALAILSPLGGLGIELEQHLELELVLPLSHAAVDPGDQTDFMIGNPLVALSYLSWGADLRYKIGGGLALPAFDADDPVEGANAGGAAAIRGFQDAYLWSSETLSLVAPFRIEGGNRFVWSVDAGFIIPIPVADNGDDVDVELQVAPGIGGYLGAAGHSLIGLRMPLFWALTEDGDNTQSALEPFFRQQIGSGFFNTRLTVNLDSPAGFAFEDGGIWGLHVGGGGAF